MAPALEVAEAAAPLRQSNGASTDAFRTRNEPPGGAGIDDVVNGAGEGIRTLDPNLGKVVLYP
jgi:hypothetical protein